ncbi:MAG: hypothetical protein MUD01_03615 [Chloroflexaceae bacterium]|jgi:hypothetical protein|nr:hypothetical protein [Chloroflexaceae bacterium]
MQFDELDQRGIGLYWETYTQAGFNPKTNEATTTERRRLHRERNLPLKDEYDLFLRTRIGG